MIKHKYLTLLYHNDIQLGLERDETFKVIRRAILKDLTTVSKKIKLKRPKYQWVLHPKSWTKY